jgi:hypothetical protein
VLDNGQSGLLIRILLENPGISVLLLKMQGGGGLPLLLSQTARAMLLGALIATAGLWIFIMTVAMGYVAFRM